MGKVLETGAGGAPKRLNPGEAAGRGSLRSMHKAIAVLDCFSRYDRSLSLNEISQRCGMPKTTIHRIVSSLREVKLLEQDKERDRYKLGIRLFELGSMVLANLDITREARPLIDRLIKVSGEGSHLCVFDGTNMVVVEHREPHQESVNWTTTLSISPSYCTGVGKAALAFQQPAIVDRVIRSGLIPYTPRTITDPKTLREELAQIRKRGYAIDEGEHQPDVRCVAAPVFNATGRAFAALSVTGPMARVTLDRVPALSTLVVATAQELSRQLGYEGPQSPRKASKKSEQA